MYLFHIYLRLIQGERLCIGHLVKTLAVFMSQCTPPTFPPYFCLAHIFKKACVIEENANYRVTYAQFFLNVGLNYTPGIYADGYIVFAFPFVHSYVRSWNLRQSFALKFLKWCISQQLLIRKHSYLDHSYPGGLAFSP